MDRADRNLIDDLLDQFQMPSGICHILNHWKDTRAHLHPSEKAFIRTLHSQLNAEQHPVVVQFPKPSADLHDLPTNTSKN